MAHHDWRTFFGDAAFGWPQSVLALAVVGTVLVLMLVAIVTRRNLPMEMAFLIGIAGALLSNVWGMLIITLGSLVGSVLLGAIVSRLRPGGG